mmetsp:Transcript_60302/g.140933  ORF Transcript_60302/g.140933 Transcript_60302/m.140933 type:complete len:270 (+) Transcript_60302:339-1148(+)
MAATGRRWTVGPVYDAACFDLSLRGHDVLAGGERGSFGHDGAGHAVLRGGPHRLLELRVGLREGGLRRKRGSGARLSDCDAHLGVRGAWDEGMAVEPADHRRTEPLLCPLRARGCPRGAVSVEAKALWPSPRVPHHCPVHEDPNLPGDCPAGHLWHHPLRGAELHHDVPAIHGRLERNVWPDPGLAHSGRGPRQCPGRLSRRHCPRETAKRWEDLRRHVFRAGQRAIPLPDFHGCLEDRGLIWLLRWTALHQRRPHFLGGHWLPHSYCD